MTDTSTNPPMADPVLPAYLQIAAALRREIQEGRLKPHEAIPAERTLCEQHGVSRMTARRALSILQREGAVYKDGRRGTFVADARLPIRIGSFSREVSKSGQRPSAEVIWVKRVAAPAHVSSELNLRQDSYVYAIQRLRRSNDETVALETSYYPADLLPQFLEANLEGSLWELLEQDFDVRVTHTEARVEVVVLDHYTSSQLQVRPAGSGLKLTRKSYDQDHRCVEYAEDQYRADKVVLQIERVI